jgi:glutaredoxin-like protein NrdH
MPMLYALSTCPYCKMTKKLLDENGVAYEHIDVDLMEEGPEREAVVAEVKARSGGTSFPVLVLDDDEVIVGFDKPRIVKALGLE